MALKTYNPTSEGRRTLITTDRSDLWKGKPVKFVVGIAGVNNSHMSILRKIALTFSNNEKVARLEAATTEQEVLDILGEK